jgi:hypothetical protein
MISTIWRVGNLGLAFALELAAIVALCYWGFHVGGSTLGKALLGIGAPAVAIVLWGLFAAPNASHSSPLLHWATVVLVFGGAAIGLWTSGRPLLGVSLLVVFVLNLAIINVMHLNG